MTGPAPGWWMVRCCRGCPEVVARIWLCDHEPGDPENKVDQPYLQGQLGLDLVDPNEIWVMLEYCEAGSEEQALLRRPLALRTDVQAGRVARAATAPMALWKRERARRISAAEYAYQLADYQWLRQHRPNDPNARPTEKVQIRNLELPF